MAEFLVMRSNYWYDAGEISAKNTLGETKFHAGVHRPWDSLKVVDNGHYLSDDYKKGAGWDHEAFYLVRAPDITVQFTKQYTGPLLDMASLEPEKPVLKCHRWHFANLPAAIKAQLEADRTIKIPWATLQPYITEKTA